MSLHYMLMGWIVQFILHMHSYFLHVSSYALLKATQNGLMMISNLNNDKNNVGKIE
jgi:hypothetical protein